MPLSEDSRALLQLLLGRGKSYSDISGLLGIDEAEVRRQRGDGLGRGRVEPRAVIGSKDAAGKGGGTVWALALDPVEGAVWRCERQGAVDFLGKYVRPDKIDGKYLPELSERFTTAVGRRFESGDKLSLIDLY